MDSSMNLMEKRKIAKTAYRQRLLKTLPAQSFMLEYAFYEDYSRI